MTAQPVGVTRYGSKTESTLRSRWMQHPQALGVELDAGFEGGDRGYWSERQPEIVRNTSRFGW